MPKKTPLPRRSPELRKQLIVDAATEILSQKPYDTVPISEIVKRAGVAQGTFFLYFPKKLDILKAVRDRLFGSLALHLEQIAQEEMTTVKYVGEVHRFAFQSVKKFSALLFGLESDKTSVSRAHGDRPEPPTLLFTELSRHIRQDQDKGIVDADMDPDVAARLIVSLIDRFMRDMHQEGVTFDEKKYTKQLLTFTARALGAKPQASARSTTRLKRKC